MLITLISLAINDLNSYLSVFNNTILYVNNDCVFCRWISDVKRHNFFCSHLHSVKCKKLLAQIFEGGTKMVNRIVNNEESVMVTVGSADVHW